MAFVGVIFIALTYPMITFARQEPALSITFAAWSSFAHAALMGTQAMENMVAHSELIGVAVLVVIGGALVALAPSKQLRSVSKPSGLGHITL